MGGSKLSMTNPLKCCVLVVAYIVLDTSRVEIRPFINIFKWNFCFCDERYMYDIKTKNDKKE